MWKINLILPISKLTKSWRFLYLELIAPIDFCNIRGDNSEAVLKIVLDIINTIDNSSNAKSRFIPIAKIDQKKITIKSMSKETDELIIEITK